VSGNNLHRDEARQRAELLEVWTTTVDLDFSGGSETTFHSVSEVHFSCREPGASTFVNLTAAAVSELTLNGTPLDPAEVYNGHRIVLPSLDTDNVLRVVADCIYMRTGEGLHRFVDPVDGEVYLYTQFETFDAHRAYACFDQPDLKSAFTFTVDGPAHWQIVSNTAMTAEPVEVRPGVRRWAFAETPRMSAYITAIVAGPYHHVHDVHVGVAGEIPLGLYCRTSLAEHLDADELFEVTKQGFGFFERSFDYPYPFGKYDQLFVPEFNAGAMENAGCVTILEDYVFRARETRALYERRSETVLHEMAHMWFGDLVTMRWWDDLWLNESFATYMAVLAQAEATEYDGAWATFCSVEKTWAYRQDQLPSTHPIAADIVDNEAVKVNFDGITYAKGASVLKQLVAWVGREEFADALRGYFRRHEWGNTTLRDLLSALEAASGRDLSAWSNEWLETAGVNTLRARFEVDDDGTFSSFSLLQEAAAEHPTLRSHRLAIGLYDRTGDGLVRRDRIELDVVGAVTDVPKLVGIRRPDLLLINDDDLAYAKIRLDERSLATLRAAIGALPHPLARALCWAAAWDMTRDAELPARDYVSLVLGGIDSETDVGMVQTLLRQATLAIDAYAEPGWRPVGLKQMATSARERLFAAEPGSDLQLVWARSLAAAARSEDDVDLLCGILRGTEIVQGLQVDTELRWTLLTRLAALGALGERDIDAEVDRDNTSAGVRHACAARAARPDPAAKEAAWRSVVDSDELPNAVLAATIGGFQQPDQRELLEPYVGRYFDAVGRIWAERTLDMAHGVAVGLYPGLVVSDATLASTDAYLATHHPPAALRRVLLEGRAGIARALAAQDRDRRAGSASRAG